MRLSLDFLLGLGGHMDNLTPFQIVKDGDTIYIVNTNTGTKGPTLKNCADTLKSLKRMQARLNSSYALNRMGIY